MRKVVSGWVSSKINLEPMLVEMCGRIGAVIQNKRNKRSVRVSVRIILEGEHPQAEEPNAASTNSKSMPCPLCGNCDISNYCKRCGDVFSNG